MNLEITIKQALVLEEIIADRHYQALRMVNNDAMSDEMRFRSRERADVCLEILNTLQMGLMDHV